jgi:branched-chain amino acid transport system ATP-binding protein
MAVILELRGLTRRFGGITAVDRVDLRVERGELRAIIGPNGSGKTTLFQLISRAIPPTAGRIVYDGRDITAMPEHRLAHIGIARSFQTTNVFPELSVLENLRVAVQARHAMLNFWRAESAFTGVRHQAERLLESLGLGARRAHPAGTLSHGEQRYLDLGVALAADPALLLLDEPTAGMSARERVDAAAFIERLRGRVTILMVEHDMDLVMRMADCITVLHEGRVVAEDTPAMVARDHAVREIYLGGT